MSVRAVERVVHCVFMVVNWLNIVLIVESVVQSMVSLVIHFMAICVLMLMGMPVVIAVDAICVTI